MMFTNSAFLTTTEFLLNSGSTLTPLLVRHALDFRKVRFSACLPYGAVSRLKIGSYENRERAKQKRKSAAGFALGGIALFLKCFLGIYSWSVLLFLPPKAKPAPLWHLFWFGRPWNFGSRMTKFLEFSNPKSKNMKFQNLHFCFRCCARLS